MKLKVFQMSLEATNALSKFRTDLDIALTHAMQAHVRAADLLAVLGEKLDQLHPVAVPSANRGDPALVNLLRGRA